jgi:uncharacterized BrkB/YihY/UPF0761 family membrane protein
MSFSEPFIRRPVGTTLLAVGLLLVGAVAYYALLSIVPLLILVLIVLSHVIDQALLFETMERYLGWLFPGQGRAVLAELKRFVEHREVLGWVLAATLFSSARSPSPC